jgi:ATP-dependent Zn protease
MSERRRTELTAYHEAGHAVALLRLGVGRLRYVTIVPKETRYCVKEGHISVDYGGKDPGVEKVIMFLLGGLIGERFAGARKPHGCGSDLYAVLRLAEELRPNRRHLVRPEWHARCRAPEWRTRGREAVLYARARDAEWRASMRFLWKLVARARALLEPHRAEIKRVAEALLVKRRLRGAEVEALLADGPPRRALEESAPGEALTHR